MCGICAYIGYDNAFEICFDGIVELLNRGYDSVGITTITDGGHMTTDKYASDDIELADKKLHRCFDNHNGTIGIAHSRWRVVGAKTDINAHPHVDAYNSFSLVHNGIIENYAELKHMLQEKGMIFKSETDTEVIVNLISYNYNILHMTELDAIQNALNNLVGTYALAILCVNTPNKMYCVRNGSPLLIGLTDDNTFAMLASEKYGFEKGITKYFSATMDDVIIFEKDATLNEVHMTSTMNITYDFKTFVKGNDEPTPYPFPHWTIREINDQHNTCLNAIKSGSRITDDCNVKLNGFDKCIHLLHNIKNVILLGCGTSFHAGMYSTHLFKHLCNFSTVYVYDGGEFTESDIPKEGKTCFIFISQSGETKDLHRCLETTKKFRQNGGDCVNIGVINVMESLIAREVDGGIYLNCGREHGIASTKAFTSQIIVLTLIALWFNARESCTINNPVTRSTHIAKLNKLYHDIQTTIEQNNEKCKQIAKYLKDKYSMFVLGKGTCESIAKEGALKIKELGYIHAEGYSSSALKHGPYTLLVKDIPVILITPDDEHFSRSQGTYEELKSRDAFVIGISDRELHSGYDYGLIIPKNSYFEILATIPMQLIGYHLACEKGHNPDFLRGLAKTVTTD
jgi:glutamine---fructose-6-phosphate transaminase (isomerizing)